MVQHVQPASHLTEGRHPHSRFIFPWQVGVRSWKRIAKLMITEIGDDRLTIVAGGLAFYAMMALFPGLIAMVSLFGLIADPATIEEGLRQLSAVMPPGGRELLREQLHELVSTPSRDLSIGLVISVITALWSSSSGVDSLVDAMNVVYNKLERRKWIKRRMMSLLMTLAVIQLTTIAIALVAILPSLMGWLGEQLNILRIISIARWPTLAMVVIGGLFLLYRYAPCRRVPHRSDVSGPILATIGFLAFSSLFSLYVSEFAAYHKTYGAVGSVVALLFWFYYSSFMILIGAEVSAAIEGEKKRELSSPSLPSGTIY